MGTREPDVAPDLVWLAILSGRLLWEPIAQYLLLGVRDGSDSGRRCLAQFAVLLQIKDRELDSPGSFLLDQSRDLAPFK